MIGIIYGSTLGNTENAANAIADKLKESELVNVSEISKNTFDKYDVILLGSSTWGSGELQDDWESKINILKDLDFSGKKIGFFGHGDQEMYSDTYVDALGILYEAVKDSNCEFVGQWPTDGYSFTNSSAVVDGKFVGLALDENNQPDLTDSRITAWTDILV